MTRLAALAIVVGASTAIFADDPTPAGKDVLAKMAGNWLIEKAEIKGEAPPADVLKKLTFSIKGDQIVGKDPNDPATLALDPSKSPAEINLTEKNGKVSLGIYKLDGDKLELCFCEAGDPRPKEFKGTKENKAMYFVLSRKKN